MKLPDVLSQFLAPKKPPKELYFSLLLDVEGVSGAVWTVEAGGTAAVVGTVSKALERQSWEDRIQAADTVIAQLEDKAGTTEIFKVILGLPQEFLTPEGDILKEIRPEIKNLTQALDLRPMGFVSLPQALVHKLKKDEGVPPSVILIEVTNQTLSVALYKVGTLAEQVTIENNESLVASAEAAFKSFKNIEVLPSRILLYGADPQMLQQVDRELMRHPWTTKANFLHFPKIEIVSGQEPIVAVSLAGANELAQGMGGKSEEIQTEEASPTEGKKEAMPLPARTPVPEKQPVYNEPDTVPKEEDELEEARRSEEEDEESNVVLVAPEQLGFKKNVDVLEQEESEEKAQVQQKKPSGGRSPLGAIPKLPSMSLPSMPGFLSALADRLRGNMLLPVGLGGLLVVALLLVLVVWILPAATVTIYEIPKNVDQTLPVGVDPTGTVVDSQNKTIPGKKEEKSVSGDKTIPVTGKKKVGDPAKGTVTIYNKSLFSRTFKKGAVVTAGSVQFTLDADVPIASASESVGSITFGKANADVTAAAIGAESNIPASTELTFKDTSPSIAVARNDQAFTGGTSRDVTVVSRADYDNLVKELTKDLVERAKQDLTNGVGGGEKLIDATIKTAVTEKVFDQELDEQVTQLHGKITVTISGISYKEQDLRTLAKDTSTGVVPQGYSIVEGRTTVALSDVLVKKDGKISATAKITSVAAPTIAVEKLKSDIVGKHLSAVETYLRGVPGIGSAEFSFHRTFSKNSLPTNKNNIIIKLVVQE